MSRKFIFFTAYSLLFACQLINGQACEWTRFRGSQGNGIESNRVAPVTWDKADFKWEIELPGIGNASPVVWGNTIFVNSADEDQQTGYLMAIDELRGEVLWKEMIELSDLKMHQNNKFASATPAVDSSQVYSIWIATEKIILSAHSHDGILKWRSSFEGIEARHGAGSSLVLAGRNVVFTREQEVDSAVSSSWVAVDRQTGNLAWELERETSGSNSFSTPILVGNERGDGQLIFASNAHGLTGVDPSTGMVLWERKDLMPHRVVASPVYADGLVIGCCKAGARVLRIDPVTNRVSDTALYSIPVSLAPYVPTPIVVEGLLFSFRDNGTVVCMDFDTGKLHWKERPSGAFFGSPICVDGNLYCITKEGEVVVISAESSYHLHGTYDLGDGSFSTPAVCSSGMLFRTFRKLMLLANQSNIASR